MTLVRNRYGFIDPNAAAGVRIQSTWMPIVTSLCAADRQTGLHLARTLRDVARKAGVEVVEYEVADATSFVECLDSCSSRARKRGPPLLHIECHGEEYGLTLADGSTLTWEQLHSPLARLNRATQLNLCVFVSSCFGLFGGAIAGVSVPAPFLWIVGPEELMMESQLEALEIRYYDQLFRSGSADQALSKANELADSIGSPHLGKLDVWDVWSKGVLHNIEEICDPRYRRDHLLTTAVRFRLRGRSTSIVSLDAQYEEVQLRAIEQSWESYFLHESVPDAKRRFPFDRKKVKELIREGTRRHRRATRG